MKKNISLCLSEYTGKMFNMCGNKKKKQYSLRHFEPHPQFISAWILKICNIPFHQQPSAKLYSCTYTI